MIRRLLALALLLAIAAPAAAQKRIALTFDDVPRIPGAFMTVEERTSRLIAALRSAGVRQAAFFVNPGNLEQPWGSGGEGRIAAYVRAGHVIGNHSYSHPSLTQIGLDAWLADVDRAATWLNGRPGFRPWLRFPFLDEGAGNPALRDAVRAALAQRHLANAYITVDSWDWYLDQLATQAQAAGAPIDTNALRDLYVRIIVEAAEFEDTLARETLHRQPIQVVLMHETDLEALYVADAVAALRAHGWRIVPVDEAYRDPIAAREPDSGALGAGRIAALASEPGQPPRQLAPPLNHQDVITALFDRQVLHQPAQ